MPDDDTFYDPARVGPNPYPYILSSSPRGRLQHIAGSLLKGSDGRAAFNLAQLARMVLVEPASDDTAGLAKYGRQRAVLARVGRPPHIDHFEREDDFIQALEDWAMRVAEALEAAEVVPSMTDPLRQKLSRIPGSFLHASSSKARFEEGGFIHAVLGGPPSSDDARELARYDTRFRAISEMGLPPCRKAFEEASEYEAVLKAWVEDAKEILRQVDAAFDSDGQQPVVDSVSNVKGRSASSPFTQGDCNVSGSSSSLLAVGLP